MLIPAQREHALQDIATKFGQFRYIIHAPRY